MSESGRRTKVERVIESYDLEGWGERLEARWLGEGTERRSLRELADEFNRAVVRAALVEQRGSVVSADVEGTYRTLAGEDAREAEQVRKRRELEREGVDVERLERDFATHQAIHTYLRRVRGASFEREAGDPGERKAETVQRLVGRTRAVTDSTLEELVAVGAVNDRPYEAVVDLRVVCRACGSDYSIEQLVERGGCRCERSGP